uniref:Protein kinase domain-containing protein n=1 Tax=viral metagenome TaxID=1070528 RepID=A0A6C0D5P7_9ZZZZ
MVNYTRKKGGRYIGEGTYGCTFYDKPLKCKAENSRNSGEVITKLLARKAAAEEYIQNHIWAEIDPKQEFSLYAFKYCKVNADNIKAEDELNKCSAKFMDPLKKRRLLFYKYGGSDLYKLKPNATNYLNLFKSFQKLIEGLSIAHKNDVVHLDIKEPNIVVDKDNHLRFIDFGLSLVSDEIDLTDGDDYEQMLTYTQLYKYWPFELKYVLSRKPSIRVVKNDVNEFYKNTRPVYDFTQANYYTKDWEEKTFGEFYDIIMKYDYKDLNTVLKNVDVYSLGTVLIRLVDKYFKHVLGLNSENHNEIKVYSNKKNKNVFLSSLSSDDFPNEKIVEYQKELAEHVTKPLLEVGQKMTFIDPTKRINAVEAAKEYEKIIPNLEKYLTLKKVYNGLKDLNILNINSTNFIPNTRTPTPRTPTPITPTPKPPTPKENSVRKQTSASKVRPRNSTKKNIPKAKSKEKVISTKKTKLDKIYEQSMKYPLELNRIVKLARALGSTLPEKTTTKEEFRDDIIRLAKGTRHDFNIS